MIESRSSVEAKAIRYTIARGGSEYVVEQGFDPDQGCTVLRVSRMSGGPFDTVQAPITDRPQQADDLIALLSAVRSGPLT